MAYTAPKQYNLLHSTILFFRIHMPALFICLVISYELINVCKAGQAMYSNCYFFFSIHLLSNRLCYFSQAITAMVQKAMEYIDLTPDMDTRIELIKTLSSVSAGKVRTFHLDNFLFLYDSLSLCV